MTIALARRDIPPAALVLAAAGMPGVLARIYAARGITSLAELDHGFSALPSPDGLRGIGAAAERLSRAIRAREKIVRSGSAVAPGERVEVELADGGFGARVEDTR